MKRTELKRKTPLRAKTALKPGGKIKRKKAKKKPKSKLARRIDKKDSSYWNRKCAEAVTEWAHMQACVICGKREPATRLVCGHHLIRKSRSGLYRWHPLNVIPLCEEHHLTSITCAAHSDNPFAVAAFCDILKLKAPKNLGWFKEHFMALRKKDGRVGQIKHPDWRYQHTIWRQRIADAKIIRQDTPDT